MEPSKEVRKKKLKKICDFTSKLPLTMSDLTGKGKNDGRKVLEVNDVYRNQTNLAA